VRPHAEKQRDRQGDELRQRLRAALIARLSDRSHAPPASRLKRLIAALDRTAADEHARSAVVEAAIADRLLNAGSAIEFEVPTHDGRTADFHVRGGGDPFHLHVKRWTPARDDEPLTLVVPGRVRDIERVRRPFLVGVRWPAAPRSIERFVAEVTAFLAQASVGDELVFRTDDGSNTETVTGGARVLAAWPGDRVVVTVGLDAALADEARRLQRLLRKACGQFMPRSDNVILVAGGDDADESRDARAFDQALQGSHVERWDLFPPRGQHVAHGRGDDGFWSGGRFPQSRVVVWCPWRATNGLGTPRFWRRTDEPRDLALEASVRAALPAQ